MFDEAGRNASRRYPMSYGLRYVMAPPAPAWPGAGETLWMSRHQVAFLAKGPACVGDKLQLFIEWPVLLLGEVPLQLVATAEIVQRAGPLNVAKLTKYEFRTRGGPSCSMGAKHRQLLPGLEPRPARRIPSTKAAAAAGRL